MSSVQKNMFNKRTPGKADIEKKLFFYVFSVFEYQQ